MQNNPSLDLREALIFKSKRKLKSGDQIRKRVSAASNIFYCLEKQQKDDNLNWQGSAKTKENETKEAHINVHEKNHLNYIHTAIGYTLYITSVMHIIKKDTVTIKNAIGKATFLS